MSDGMMNDVVTPFPCRTCVRRGKEEMFSHNLLKIQDTTNTVFPYIYTIVSKGSTMKNKSK